MNYSKRIIKECQQYIVKSQFRRNKSGIYCFDQKKNDKESKVSSEGINQEYIVLTRKRMIRIKSQFRRNKSGIYCFDQKKNDKESKVSSEGINQEYIVLTRKRMIKKNKSAESWPSL